MIEQPASRHEPVEASDSELAKELSHWPVSSTASLGSNGYYGQIRLQGLSVEEYKGGLGHMISVGRCDALTGCDRCSSRSQSLSNLYTVFQLEPLFFDTIDVTEMTKIMNAAAKRAL